MKLLCLVVAAVNAVMAVIGASSGTWNLFAVCGFASVYGLLMLLYVNTEEKK